jgi:hypothetical protein
MLVLQVVRQLEANQG